MKNFNVSKHVEELEKERKVLYEDPFKKTPEGRQRCLIYSRVMGYYQNYNNFNIGKKQEFLDRRYFQEPSLEQAKESAKEQEKELENV